MSGETSLKIISGISNALPHNELSTMTDILSFGYLVLPLIQNPFSILAGSTFPTYNGGGLPQPEERGLRQADVRGRSFPSLPSGWEVRWVFLFMVIPCPVLMRPYVSVKHDPSLILSMFKQDPAMVQKVREYHKRLRGQGRNSQSPTSP